MVKQPKITLQYIDPRIKEEYLQLQEVAISKLAMDGVTATMLFGREGSLEVSLVEVRPGGLERAVRDCVELFIPLSGIRGYNAEGLTITQGVLEQLGYEFGEAVKADKKPLLARLFTEWNNTPTEHNAPYLPVVRIPARVQEIVNLT